MGLKDVFGTALVVAEAKGRGKWAGFLDPLLDDSTLLTNGVGLGTFLAHGVGVQLVVTVAAMNVTSYYSTRLTTEWLSRKMGTQAG